MKTYNIIFMGTPQFAVPALEILNRQHNVQAIICQPDRINRRGNKVIFNPVKLYGVENDIPIYQPDNVNSLESEKFIKKYNPDFIVVVAYGQFISKNIRDIPSEKIVNIHASLLPKYRGAAPIHRAIMNRDEITGVTIMEVTKGMDTGDVYLEAVTEVGQKNLEELHDELSVLGAELIIDYLNLYSDNLIKGKAQDEKLVTYAEKVSREDGIIDFVSVDKAIGQIKGLYPRPGASFKYGKYMVKALDGYIYSREESEVEPGTIISADQEGLLTQLVDGKLMITEVQFPNNRAMKFEDFINGNSIDTSIILGR